MHNRLVSFWYPCLMIPENSNQMATSLLLIVLSLVVDDVEELELVDALGGRDDAEPVTELHLLEELLGPAAAVSIESGGLIVRETHRYLR
jgi:hypothetical protein